MKLHFIDYPKYVDYENYKKAILTMVEKLKRHEEIVSIYKIGNVHNPGISDIDLVVVFNDGFKFLMNPLKNSIQEDRYLFVHGIFGASRSHFIEAQKYTFYSNYEKLWGEEIGNQVQKQLIRNLESLKKQIAAEYLLKMYMGLVIEQTYGLSKLRSLLLEGKAIGFDLEILNVNSGELYEMVEEIKTQRQNWFKKGKSENKLDCLHKEFFAALNAFLLQYLSENPLRFSREMPIKYGRNKLIKYGQSLGAYHSGFAFPSFLVHFSGRRYFNLLHRFNRFDFTVPGIFMKNSDDLIAKRFIYQKQCRQYNLEYLPYFSPLVTGLAI